MKKNPGRDPGTRKHEHPTMIRYIPAVDVKHLPESSASAAIRRGRDHGPSRPEPSEVFG